MKKRISLLCLLLTLGLIAVGCGKKEETVEAVQQETEESFDTEDEIMPEEQEEEPEEEPVEEETREGMYRSELTNEWIDESLMNQRPIAVMVDNEKTALDHYGLTQADIVYEMMNSTANGRITRFMAIVKDWGSITQFGSVRSVRPTNFMIAPEYNAVVCHDGGPMYINAFLNNPWVVHISGEFGRVNNGKSREFTEYILSKEKGGNLNKKSLEELMNSHNISTEYDYSKYPDPQYVPEGVESHFYFASENNPVDLSKKGDSIDCTKVDLPFEHNGSELNYDSASGTYLYSEYGMKHVDPANGNKQLAFTNLIILNATHTQYDEHGYMQFNIINQGMRDGYFITGGKAIPITWTKNHDTAKTRYYDADGNEITLNTGKTYIAFVPSDNWSGLVIK